MMTPPSPASPDPRIADELRQVRGSLEDYRVNDLRDPAWLADVEDLLGRAADALTASEQARRDQESTSWMLAQTVNDQARRLIESEQARQAAEQRALEAEQHLAKTDRQRLDVASLEEWLEDKQPNEALIECVTRHIQRARASATRQASEKLAETEQRADSLSHSLNRAGARADAAEKALAEAAQRVTALEAQQAAQDATITRLTSALRTFGQHTSRCASFSYHQIEGRYPSGKPCDCGLMAALAAAPRHTPEGQDA